MTCDVESAAFGVQTFDTRACIINKALPAGASRPWRRCWSAAGPQRPGNPPHSQPIACSRLLQKLQFDDLPPEVRPYKPDQTLKAELKASSAKGFDMAIGQVCAVSPSACGHFAHWRQATDFKRLRHVTVNPNRCSSPRLCLVTVEISCVLAAGQ